MVTSPSLGLVDPSRHEFIEVTPTPSILSPLTLICRDYHFEASKSTILGFDHFFVIVDSDFDHTLEFDVIKRLQNCLNQHRLCIAAYLGAYNCGDLADQFDKLRRALTCAILILSFI